jgi:hypothetical protein
MLEVTIAIFNPVKLSPGHYFDIDVLNCAAEDLAVNRQWVVRCVHEEGGFCVFRTDNISITKEAEGRVLDLIGAQEAPIGFILKMQLDNFR